MNADFIEWIGDLFTESFKILPILGDGFNWFIIAIISALTLFWIKKMSDYKKEANQNGTME